METGFMELINNLITDINQAHEYAQIEDFINDLAEQYNMDLEDLGFETIIER